MGVSIGKPLGYETNGSIVLEITNTVLIVDFYWIINNMIVRFFLKIFNMASLFDFFAGLFEDFLNSKAGCGCFLVIAFWIFLSSVIFAIF